MQNQPEVTPNCQQALYTMYQKGKGKGKDNWNKGWGFIAKSAGKGSKGAKGASKGKGKGKGSVVGWSCGQSSHRSVDCPNKQVGSVEESPEWQSQEDWGAQVCVTEGDENSADIIVIEVETSIASDSDDPFEDPVEAQKAVDRLLANAAKSAHSISGPNWYPNEASIYDDADDNCNDDYPTIQQVQSSPATTTLKYASNSTHIITSRQQSRKEED